MNQPLLLMNCGKGDYFKMVAHSPPIEVALYEPTSPVNELWEGGLLQNGGPFSADRGRFI